MTLTAQNVSAGQAAPAVELTILMPCLNEAETLECCINKARRFLASNSITGEIIVADNGSTRGRLSLAHDLVRKPVPTFRGHAPWQPRCAVSSNPHQVLPQVGFTRLAHETLPISGKPEIGPICRERGDDSPQISQWNLVLLLEQIKNKSSASTKKERPGIAGPFRADEGVNG